MKIRKGIVINGLIGATLATIAITFLTVHFASAAINNGFDLAKACNNASVTNGLGQVTLNNSLTIQNASITITAPCEVHLTNGADLNIANSEVVTDKLAILDDSTIEKASPVSIINSHLSSTDGGLFVRLQHGSDNINIQNSVIDYPLSVEFATADMDGTNHNGNLDVVNTAIRSVGSASEGILLVSNGKGEFDNDNFSTNANDNLALLSASSCQMANDVGAAPKCQVQ